MLLNATLCHDSSSLSSSVTHAFVHQGKPFRKHVYFNVTLWEEGNKDDGNRSTWRKPPTATRCHIQSVPTRDLNQNFCTPGVTSRCHSPYTTKNGG